jgi:hypothetical protein
VHSYNWDERVRYDGVARTAAATRDLDWTCNSRIFTLRLLEVGPDTEFVRFLVVDGAYESDILWHNSGTGETQIWRMNGHRVFGRATVLAEDGRPALVRLPWSIVGSNDFNQDGTSDILWHNSATGETQIWHMNGHRVIHRPTVLAENGRPALVGAPWRIAGTSDFNQDGAADILWHNGSNGEMQVWHLNGHKIIDRPPVLSQSGSPALIGAPWRIAGTNDFNNDGAPDILWHNASTGETQIWHMNGHRLVARATVLGQDGSAASVKLPWAIVGTNKVARYGAADILWHNSSTRETQVWNMDGHRITGRATVVGENGSPALVGLPWSIVGRIRVAHRDINTVP